MIKDRFIDTIWHIAAQEGWDVHTYGEGWITEFTKGERHFLLYGYTFPLNNASSQALAKDKAGASQAMARQGVPCVPHALIFNDEVGRDWYRLEGDILGQQLDTVLARFGEDVVLKPNLGLSGRGVVHMQSRAEAHAMLSDVLQHHRDYAVAPFVAKAREIRVVVLDDEPLCLFEKTVQEGEWRHNLAHGAIAIPVEDADLREQCIDLAKRGMQALGLRLASADVFVTEDTLQLIEVNSGIMLEKMAEQLPDGRALARAAYTKIFQACTRL